MPYQRERQRERLREHVRREQDQGELIEQVFPVRGAEDDGQGINPREPVTTLDLTGVSLVGFGSMDTMTT
jgi:hypothetical protein